jgi:hypothetical protein
MVKRKSLKKKSLKRKSLKKKSLKKKSLKKKSLKKKSLKTGGRLEVYKKLFGSYTYGEIGIKTIKNTYNKKFKPYLIIDKNSAKLKYGSGKSSYNLGLHIGQRKLLLSEVQFLNNNTQKYCIYPGSAPSHKTHFLSTLFPDVKFILIDPNIFEIKIVENNGLFRKQQHKDIVMLYYGFPTISLTYSGLKKKKNEIIEKLNDNEIDEMLNFIKTSNHKIFIIEDFMTNKLALILKKLGTCNFISDIRSNVTNTSPIDFDIVWNRSMVHNWISTLQPEISMVKFRVPYFNEPEDFNDYEFAKESFNTSKNLKKGSIDFIAEYKNQKFKMSKATLYLQTWAGPTSTEMRGWIKKSDISNIVNYDHSEIEDKLFYYNKIIRVNYHENKFANKELHFCNCNDCAIESTIWQDYIKNISKKEVTAKEIEHYINITNKVTSRNLKDKHTQIIYEPLTEKKLGELINMKNLSTEYGRALNKGNTGIRN